MRFFGWGYSESEEEARERFKTLKLRILEATVVSFAMSSFSVFVVWKHIWSPHHLKLGLIIYILSYVPYVYKVYLTRKTWIEYSSYDYAYTFLKRQKAPFIAFTIIVFLILMYHIYM